MDPLIQEFFDGDLFAVVGASENRQKYGNKVLRVYQQNDKQVFPVNPNATEIEGLPAYPNLSSIGQAIHGVSIITPPAVTETVVDEMIQLGIKHVWMQPGAESNLAIQKANQAGIKVIAGGPCILVVLGFQDQ